MKLYKRQEKKILKKINAILVSQAKQTRQLLT